MSVFSLNHALFALPPDHIARRFLERFVAIRRAYVGIELESANHASIDQIWKSRIDGREWRLSKFLYTFISFDIELDGWLNNSGAITKSEMRYLETFPYMRRLVEECRSAASQSGNPDSGTVISICDDLDALLILWEECVVSRLENLPRIT